MTEKRCKLEMKAAGEQLLPRSCPLCGIGSCVKGLSAAPHKPQVPGGEIWVVVFPDKSGRGHSGMVCTMDEAKAEAITAASDATATKVAIV